jgi:LuxR family transcriptional regulator, quorum-sensing system regulator CciR
MQSQSVEFSLPLLNETLESLTVRSMSGIRAAALALQDAAMSLGGLRTAACANIASKNPMVDADGAILARDVFGWTEPGQRWWEQPKLALTSPLTLACRYESDPFWCNTHGIYTQQFNSHLASLDLSDFFQRAMAKVAIVVPIHLPYGLIAAVSFRPSDMDREDMTEEFSRYADVLGLYARRFVSSYVKVMNKHRSIPPDVCLSKREVECLRWAAAGKTDGEIATILSRSCATIRFHIHNAAQKLNAVNRSQTVFKAGQLGFLGSAS